MLAIAAALGGFGGIIFAAAEVLSWASLGRIPVGAGGGVVFVCTLKIGTDWFPPERLAMLAGGVCQALGLAGRHCLVYLRVHARGRVVVQINDAIVGFHGGRTSDVHRV